MALNFVQYINTNSTLSAAQKTALLDKFVYAHGYTDNIVNSSGATVPNPISKAQFFNRDIGKYILSSIANHDGLSAGVAASNNAIATVNATYQAELGAEYLKQQ